MSSRHARNRAFNSSHARAIPKQRHIGRWIALVIILLVLAAAAAAGTAGLKLYRSAMSAKGHLTKAISTAQSLKDGDLTTSLTNLDGIIGTMQTETAAAKQDLSDPLWTIAEKAPVYGTDIKSVRTAVDTLDDFAQTTLPQLKTAANTLLKSNLSDGNGGLNLEPIMAANKQFAAANKTLTAQAKTIDDLPDAKLSVIQNALSKGKTQLTNISGKVDQLTGILNMLPNFLGVNGARNYVILAQTNSEIRGAGGMAGSVGSFSADNGKITVNEFHPNAEFHGNATDQIGDGQATLFSDLYFGTAIHNITSTPDYPQVARMASEFWQQQSFGGASDGVMSLDPVALQAMIGATGPVTINGTTFDGTNTAEFLLNKVYIDIPVAQQDSYFTGTAAQVIANMFSNMDATKMMKLAKAMMDMAEQRHFYFWSFHDEDTATLRSAGVTGEITSDAKNPVVGMYLNEMYASKIDWYVDRKTTVQKTGTTADGGATYHVTTTFTNRLTAAENASLPSYINLNTPNGTAGDRVILFAPTGGSITNISASNGAGFTEVAAYDRSTYLGQLDIPVGTTITLEYDVTTGAGAADLQFDQTPTCTSDPGVTYQGF
ncbi:Methyl-accepting chemotaxis protein [Bifidobacterium ramosum]|uniref:DUF4012 domain-containing protein n=1 Tax=Bifidobacterium ramosum TaxID=1798158 RepID=A0A6L4WYD6_9BIFI|nr:DUF4012 domain-containing protein [Bifidobacterium ramosum]KAB8287241.1 Methyl-accepting chemotaxis protein [Bifidobacterium ramosum]NEG71952.1 DUF4012 domain-containing protein [Bifidobacterium ramosum]